MRKYKNYRKIVSCAMRKETLEDRQAAHQAAYEHHKGNGFDEFRLIKACNTLRSKGVNTFSFVREDLAWSFMDQPH